MADYSGVFRTAPFPTIYGDLKTGFQFDMEVTGIFTGYLVVTVCILLMVPTLTCKKSTRHEWIYLIGSLVSLWIGGVILICAYCTNWEEGQITTDTEYVSNTNVSVRATIGVHVGFRGLNITMLGDPIKQINHTIDFNEKFYWGQEDPFFLPQTWGQGKEGFGPYAGQYNLEFHKQTARGVPLPILWAAEWWMMDGEFIRWGRYYRMGGYYSFSIAWTAWCLWLIGNILWFLAPVLGAYFTLFTGLAMLLVNLLWASIIETCNGRIGRIRIPYDAGDLVLNYSWAFYIHLLAAIIATVAGVVLIIWFTKQRAANEERARLEMERELKADRKSKKDKDETDRKTAPVTKPGKMEDNEIEMNQMKPKPAPPPRSNSIGKSGGAGVAPNSNPNPGFGGYQFAAPPTANNNSGYPFPGQGSQIAQPAQHSQHASQNENYNVDPNQGYPQQQQQPQYNYPVATPGQPPQFVPPVRMPGAMPMQSIMRRPNVGPGQ